MEYGNRKYERIFMEKNTKILKYLRKTAKIGCMIDADEVKEQVGCSLFYRKMYI